MVKMTSWGTHLRIGNWMFLWCGLNSMLRNSQNSLCLPSDYFLWKYLQSPPCLTGDTSYDEIFHFRQTHFTREEKQFITDYFTENKDKIININLGSNLQSELWFKDDIDYVKEKLKIKQEEIDKVKNKYQHFFDKKTIGIGIRRGDFVGHGCFYQIPETWYENALHANFPDYNDYNIVIFSDDIDWCKQYYQGKNFLFAEPNNTHTHADNFLHYHKDPMEQFILGTLMSNFIGGSSTFSWWQMWYVKNFNNGKVVHSNRNLIGDCAKNHYNPDYYPDNWVKYEE